MITIPDLITKIRIILKKTIDVPYSWIETIGSKLNVWAWNKKMEKQKGWGNWLWIRINLNYIYT